MIITENKILAWKAQHQSQVTAIADDCTRTFLTAMGQSGDPSTHELAQATLSAREQAVSSLTDKALLDTLPNGATEPNAQAAFCVAWLGLMPPLHIAPPAAHVALAAWRLALAAIIGSVLGMLLFGGLMHILLGMRAIGLLFGSIIGSAGVVYAVSVLARSAKMRAGLKALLGVSSVAQLLLIVSSLGLGGVWGRLAGAGLMKRVVVFMGVMGLLVFTRRDNQVDVGAFKPVVHNAITQWLDYGLLLLMSLSLEPYEANQTTVFEPALARALVDLHHAMPEDLPLMAEAVLQEARQGGLEGLQGPARFVTLDEVPKQTLLWSEDLKGEYQAFGLIEPGDTVMVEAEPVIQNGVVIDFGRVRKVRRV